MKIQVNGLKTGDLVLARGPLWACDYGAKAEAEYLDCKRWRDPFGGELSYVRVRWVKPFLGIFRRTEWICAEDVCGWPISATLEGK